jgi:predicted component of type VI protein secretion system
MAIEEGPDKGRTFDTDEVRFVIGRGQAQAQFVLSGEDPAVSRAHFQVDRRGDTFIITNRSPNRTSVNGVVTDQTLLNDNDLIKIGHSTVIRFSLKDRSELEANPNL